MDSLDFTCLANDPFVQTGVTALLGTLGTQGLLHRFPAQRLIFQFGFFLALTTLLHHHGIVPYQDGPDATLPVERVFVALAKTVWWLNGAWLAAGCARLFLFFERRPRESRLLQDLIVA